jgi:hypothetical protein
MSSNIIPNANTIIEKIVKHYPIPKAVYTACRDFRTCSDEVIAEAKKYLYNLRSMISQYNSDPKDISELIYLETIPDNIKLTNNITMYRDAHMRIGLIDPSSYPRIVCFAISLIKNQDIKIEKYEPSLF